MEILEVLHPGTKCITNEGERYTYNSGDIIKSVNINGFSISEKVCIKCNNNDPEFELVNETIGNVNLMVNIKNPLTILGEIDNIDNDKTDKISTKDIQDFAQQINEDIDFSNKTIQDNLKQIVSQLNKDYLIENFKVEDYSVIIYKYNCDLPCLSMKVGSDVDSIDFFNSPIISENLGALWITLIN